MHAIKTPRKLIEVALPLDAINAAIKKAVENGDITTWMEEADALSSEAIGLE